MMQRPVWANVTVVRSRQGMVHLRTGWNAYDGTRTACGKTVKFDKDYTYLSTFTESVIKDWWNGTPVTVCGGCLKVARARQLG